MLNIYHLNNTCIKRTSVLQHPKSENKMTIPESATKSETLMAII